MRKPASKIKEDIAKLQEQLKLAETRDAERIGRIALKAGLGEIEVDDNELLKGFEELEARFRKGAGQPRKQTPAQNPSGTTAGADSEA